MQKLYFSKESLQMYNPNRKQTTKEKEFSEILLNSSDSNGAAIKVVDPDDQSNTLPDGGWGWVIVGGSFL